MKQLAKDAAKSRSYKEGGDNLAALEASGQRDCREQDFQKKRAPEGPALYYRLLYNLHTCSQIVRGSKEQGQNDQQTAGYHSPQIGIPDFFRKQFFCFMQRHAEKNADRRAAKPENQDFSGAQ